MRLEGRRRVGKPVQLEIKEVFESFKNHLFLTGTSKRKHV